ncbi:hypothetical protein [Enterococcus sp. AZ109]
MIFLEVAVFYVRNLLTDYKLLEILCGQTAVVSLIGLILKFLREEAEMES